MRANAANDITASAWRRGDRVQIRIGVHRFTATTDEAIALACQLAEAADTSDQTHANGRSYA